MQPTYARQQHATLIILFYPSKGITDLFAQGSGLYSACIRMIMNKNGISLFLLITGLPLIACTRLGKFIVSGLSKAS